MSDNDLILLESILKTRNFEKAPELGASDFMELFVAEAYLTEYAPSWDDVQDGLVDGGGDGGIDAVYSFLNGILLERDASPPDIRKGVELDLIIIQAKTSKGIGETAVDKIRIALSSLLRLEVPDSELQTKHNLNSSIIEQFRVFKDCYQKAGPHLPRLRIRVVLAAKATEIHPAVRNKANSLIRELELLFTGAEATVDLLGARELIELTRRANQQTRTLKTSATLSEADDSFVCLVKLRDYFDFLRSDTGRIRGELFESNIRDHYGQKDVNQQIGETLKSGTQDFWWLNNGVTVVADKANLASKRLTIMGPQIVNGLQTSYELFNYFSEGGLDPNDRSILVRVVVPKSQDAIDEIIKATNSQTKIPAGALRATEKVQRDIEEHLRSQGLFYDRRKNHYKNQGKQLHQIVSIKQMAQAVCSISLQKPHEARNNPSALINADHFYEAIFSTTSPLPLYSSCIRIVRQSEAHLRKFENAETSIKKVLKLHVATVASALLCRKAKPTQEDLVKIDHSQHTREITTEAFLYVRSKYTQSGAQERLAKAAGLTAMILDGLDDLLSGAWQQD
ncbi:MAG: AIPR family protein [Myxococcaceae bacterium]|nr:AIPR family protein [Myxococcaceae bacterium]